MCGLAGFIDRACRTGENALRAQAARMAERLTHRGPDDADTWVDAAAGVALGFRRLAILDLSPAGRQPMVSSDGRLVVVFNGEIYNFRELRAELEACGRSFRGHSDTEVMVEGFAEWGVEPTVRRLIGMFAIALWERDRRRLTLIRDRLGIKPMYWARFGSLTLFGSELKALRVHPGWTPEIDRDATAAYLRYNYVPGPLSIYRGVRKLEPGRMLVVGPDGEPETRVYWDMRAVALDGAAERLEIDDAEALERLEALLGDAVARRMVADVPLGAFLSGGVDSSTVVALMQAHGSRPVQTYTIGFREPDHDESAHAHAVARHLGTDHTELYAEPGDALDVIPSLPEMFDEPFADSSQIPTFLVSKLTRRHVTVALSGDGGDEVFGGYNRYFWAHSLNRWAGWAPPKARRAAAALITALPPGAWDSLFARMPRRLRLPQAGDKVAKLASVLAAEDVDAMYRLMVTHWDRPERLVPGASEPGGVLWDQGLGRDLSGLVDRMQFLDTVTYLPDDILTKVDRASMAVSLEARVPCLDHRVVELAWRLPVRMKVRDGEGKWLLRRLLYKHVPRRLIERPKQGFAVPVGPWLRGPLRAWAEELLDPRALAEDDLLEPAPIRRRWAEHLSGRRNWQHQLWGVLMLQAWRRAAANG
ncbi:MAG: asparagine synthase (glutamine-hydrolyzing) [Kiloniellales bacterium]